MGMVRITKAPVSLPRHPPFRTNIGYTQVLVECLDLYEFDSVIANMIQLGTGNTSAKANR